MRRSLIPVLAVLSGALLLGAAAQRQSYLFLWAGDADGRASDFLAVIDATPSSPGYGRVVASVPTGMIGAHPHHTEADMPANGHLLANGFHAGRTWLFDLTQPLHPTILTSFGDVAGFSHPHSFVRLPNGHVLSTFQYAADSGAMTHETSHDMAHDMAHPMSLGGAHATGGLVEMDERGTPIRSGPAHDGSIGDERIYPYSVLPLPALDRAVVTTTDMDEADTIATSQWVQLWRLSDLKLLRSIALPPGPRGDENRYTGEPRLLPDGRSAYIHTFNCGLYLLRDIDGAAPQASFVTAFQGKNCGVPILTRHYWLQTVPEAHALVALDVANPEHPREVSRVTLGADEQPHWISLDPAGRRVVLNSSDARTANRLYVIDLDPRSGALSLDAHFRDPGDSLPGITLSRRTWPHGFTGTAMPHGTVFSR
jgi:hypothetical protein